MRVKFLAQGKTGSFWFYDWPLTIQMLFQLRHAAPLNIKLIYDLDYLAFNLSLFWKKYLL